MNNIAISADEFAQRRANASAELNGAAGVIFAGTGGGLEEDFRPHLHFEYLTGIIDEPGAMLVLDPTATRETHKEILVLSPHLPEVERWDGWRGAIDSSLREKFGFKTILRTNHFPGTLAQICARTKKAICLHPLSNHERPVSPDLEVFQKLQQRIPGFEIVDGSLIVPRLRAVKSANELAMIKRSAEITEEGFREVLSILRPGISEFDVQEAAEHGYRSHGSRGPFYGTIVGTGFNGTILHYRANDQIIACSGYSTGNSSAGEGCDGQGQQFTFHCTVSRIYFSCDLSVVDAAGCCADRRASRSGAHYVTEMLQYY
jgi:Xaa-Pro aminopeptidase